MTDRIVALRYRVLDEAGQLVRAFWSRAEAERFLSPDQGETLQVAPRPPKRKPMINFEPAPF